MLFRAAIAACVACSAASVYAQPDPIARARLEKAAEAIKALNALTYHVEFTCEGLLVSQSATADVSMLRSAEQPTRWRVKWVGSYKVAGDPASPIHLAFNPATGLYTWQDELHKEWGRRPESQVPKPILEGKNNAWIEDFSKAEPLADQIASPEITPEADAEVAGVPCEVVLVRPEKGYPKRWALGKEDHLPRRVELLLEGGGIKGRFVYELTNLTADPALTPEEVDIPYSEGYIKNEAPPPPPPPPPGQDASTTSSGRGTVTGPEISMPPAKVVGPAVANIAPDFELTRADLDGQGEGKVRLSELRGRAVVLEFGGSWNARSKTGHPEFKALAERFKDKPVTFATISVREKDPAKPVEYMKHNAYPWSLLLSGDDTAKTYKVRVYPTYFVISPEGDVAHVAVDFEKGKTMPKIGEVLDLFAGAPAPPAGETPKPAGDGG